MGFGIYLTMATGIRLGELLGLNWKDVDLEENTITICQTLNRLPNYDEGETKTDIVIGTPKSQQSFRIIPLNDEVVRVMSEYRAKMGNISPFVICNEIGQPIEPRTYQDNFKRYMIRAGISGVTFHGLRHTFAIRALEKNIQVKIVSELLGHSSVTITMDLYYSYISHELKKEAIQKLSFLSI